MFLLPHAKARHMSIIHVLVYFSKLENGKKIIKKERTTRRPTRAEKCVKRERETERQSKHDDRFTIRPENSVKRP